MLISGLALGAVLGFVMQRGRFCVTGFLREEFSGPRPALCRRARPAWHTSWLKNHGTCTPPLPSSVC